jgi:hypothetical protein
MLSSLMMYYLFENIHMYFLHWAQNIQVGSGAGRIRNRLASWIGAGFVIQDYGFADPDPKEIVTVPQNC